MLVGAGLAACGGAGHKTASHSSTHTGSTSASPSVRVPAPIATAAAGLYTGDGHNQYRISIYDLRRAGPFLVLDFGITCLSPSTGCGTVNSFAPNASAHGPIIGKTGQDQLEPAGVFLVDPVADKAYYAARDGDRRPFTTAFSSITLRDSLTHLEWVRYPAPPATVNSLDVVFPDGGPRLGSIPISSKAGPSAAGNLRADPPAAFSQPPTSTNTSGLTLPIADLLSTVGNVNGSDTESANKATLTLRSDVLFRFAKANLTSSAHSVLETVAGKIKSRASGTVQVTGYTDSIGSDAVNIPLSLARARAVVGALRPLTAGLRYVVAGMGAANPVAPNTSRDGSDDPAGRALNRRVTIAFVVKAPAKPTPPTRPTGAGNQPPASSGSTVTFSYRAGSTYQASADSLFRDGNLLALHITVGCVSSKAPPPSDQSCDTQSDLGGTETVPPQQVSPLVDPQDFFTASAFYLEDPATGTAYLPLRDSYTNPVTGSIQAAAIPINDAYNFWAYLPAPPPSVTSLSLVAPGGRARIGNLAIASGPPVP